MKYLIYLSSEHYSQAIFWQRTVATGIKHKDSSKVVSVRLECNDYSCVGTGDELPYGRIDHVDEFVVNYETIIEDLQGMQKEWSHALSIFWNIDIFKAYLLLPEERREDLVELLNNFTSEQHFMYCGFENYDRSCKELSQDFWDQMNIAQYEWPPEYNLIGKVVKGKTIFPKNRVDIVTDIIEERLNSPSLSVRGDWVIATSKHVYAFNLPEKSNFQYQNEWAASADFSSDPHAVGRDFIKIKRKVFIRKLFSFFK